MHQAFRGDASWIASQAITRPLAPCVGLIAMPAMGVGWTKGIKRLRRPWSGEQALRACLAGQECYPVYAGIDAAGHTAIGLFVIY